jgi:Raf kinase inhibitor-like YbhB/YbcL family protein
LRPWARRSAIFVGVFAVAAIVVVILHATARSSSFGLSSPAFRNNGTIPARYTCVGRDLSPPLRWRSPPPLTQAFALVVSDPDAPGGTFIHWLAWNIPSKIRSLAAGARPPVQGKNRFGKIGYGGPCPPRGRAHRYVFRLYALDNTLKLPSGASYSELSDELQKHAFVATQLVARFGR